MLADLLVTELWAIEIEINKNHETGQNVQNI